MAGIGCGCVGMHISLRTHTHTHLAVRVFICSYGIKFHSKVWMDHNHLVSAFCRYSIPSVWRLLQTHPQPHIRVQLYTYFIIIVSQWVRYGVCDGAETNDSHEKCTREYLQTVGSCTMPDITRDTKCKFTLSNWAENLPVNFNAVEGHPISHNRAYNWAIVNIITQSLCRSQIWGFRKTSKIVQPHRSTFEYLGEMRNINYCYRAKHHRN